MDFKYRNERNAKSIAAFWGKSLDARDWYKIESLSSGQKEIIIYDVIGWPFNDVGEIAGVLSELRNENVKIRINSRGGDVFDGISLANAIMAHGNVTTIIEGIAASIAGIVAISGKNVQAYISTMFMLHDAWVTSSGNQYDFREIANILEKVSGNMLEMYANKSNIGKRELKQMMADETWFTAKEAKDKGFIDTIIDGKSVKAQFDLSMFANTPEGLIVAKEGRELTKREIERALRDAGASRDFAKAIAAGCSNGETDNQRDVESLKVSIGELIKTIKK